MEMRDEVKQEKAAAIRKMGRPTEITEEQGELICDRISKGELMINILKEDGMPDWNAFFRLLGEKAHIREKYMNARENSATYLVEQTMEEAHNESDPAMAALVRVKADVRRWAAGKFAPQLYADVKRLEVSGEVRHAHALDLTQDQRARIAQEWIMASENAKAPALIEGTATTTGPERPPRSAKPGKAGGARRASPPTDT
jgi:hypothetical protein